MDFIPTRGSAAKRNAESDFLSIDYKSHKSKKAKNVPDSEYKRKQPDEDSSTPVINVFNIKKVKHEVVQFGMSGFSNKQRVEARVELAIKLGAKPERRKYINYKELQQQKKIESEQLKNQTDFLQLGKNSMGKSTAKGKSFDKKRKGNSSIITHYGVVKAADKVEMKNAKDKRNSKGNMLKKVKV